MQKKKSWPVTTVAVVVGGISVLSVLNGTRLVQQVSSTSSQQEYAVNEHNETLSHRDTFFAARNFTFTSTIVETSKKSRDTSKTNTNVVPSPPQKEPKVSTSTKNDKEEKKATGSVSSNSSITSAAAERFRFEPTTWNVTTSKAATTDKSPTKILGFATSDYTLNGLLWYKRLESLGYMTHELVAVDKEAAEFFQNKSLRFSKIKYKLSTPLKAVKSNRQFIVKYRRELFARRWFHIYDLMKETNNSYLLTDVDNIWNRHLPMESLENSDYDMFLAYSNAYPQNIFYQVGFTVCGGMGWFRNNERVRGVIAELLSRCKCSNPIHPRKCFCDDQVVLNTLFSKGKYRVQWDGPALKLPPKDDNDIPFASRTGTVNTTNAKIFILDRGIAFRDRMPKTSKDCPINNWVAMPAHEQNKTEMIEVWDERCNSGLSL